MTEAEHSQHQRDMMPGWLGRVRRIVFGKPVHSSSALEHRLPVYLALPVFASDALSSVAYGTEEILIVLAGVLAAGGPALGAQLPITLGIAVLMVIVSASYHMAIAHYPSSGGAYTVAKSNLGVIPGLTAASALALDYIMTVAVSVSAGVAALTSVFPELHQWRVYMAVVLVIFIALVNLRGVREAGWIFAIPAYTFIGVIGILILSSIYHAFTGTASPAPLPEGAILPDPAMGLGLFVILRAFSNGCSAMTGIEAVSNGISAFERPEAKHAQQTLIVLASILIFLFVGVGFSAHTYHIVPSHTETVLTQLARANFGEGFMLHLVAFVTLIILMIAANTSFAGFPRLLSIVAADGYAPRILTQLGDKLVYNRGIYSLTLISLLLIIAFKASVNALIPLYAVGVFLSFTLSQAGLACKVIRERVKHWQRTGVMSIFGATVTGIVACVIIVSKFTQGAWVVAMLIPLLVWTSRTIKAHYDWFMQSMKVDAKSFNLLRDPAEPLTVVTLLSDLNRGALEGLDCALDIAGGRKDSRVRAVHVELVPEATERLRERWRRYVEPFVGKHVRLEVVPSPYRWLIPPVTDYIDRIHHEFPHDRIVVIIPEFETGNTITHLLHNASARRLYSALLFKPNVTIVSCRFFMRPLRARMRDTGSAPMLPLDEKTEHSAGKGGNGL